MNKFKSSSILLASMVCSLLLAFNLRAQDMPKLTDAQVASAVVTANQIDVNYGNLALKKSKNKEVIKFANTMIKDHNDIIHQSVELANKLGVVPEDNAVTQSLLDGEKEMMKKLNKLNGVAFDNAYLENEVAYHEAVIAAVKDVLLPQTKNKELRETIMSVAPLLDHHLEMAKMANATLKK